MTYCHYSVKMYGVYKYFKGGAFLGICKVLQQLVSITQFNKGKASQLFSRVQKGETLIVIKNNTPVAVVIPPKEYEMIEEYLSAKRKENHQ